MKNNCGVSTPRLQTLRPVLQKWIDMNCALAKDWNKENDTPWWYNERALISIFAGAVWKCGGYSFEEYSDLKRSSRGRKFKAGRVDLEFAIESEEFMVEAKQKWIAITQKKDNLKEITQGMNDACDDARRTQAERKRCLAFLFGQPYIKTKNKDEIDVRINRLLKQARAIKADAMAWSFPSIPICHDEDGWLYPGIILWIKEVKMSQNKCPG